MSTVFFLCCHADSNFVFPTSHADLDSSTTDPRFKWPFRPLHSGAEETMKCTFNSCCLVTTWLSRKVRILCNILLSGALIRGLTQFSVLLYYSTPSSPRSRVTASDVLYHFLLIHIWLQLWLDGYGYGWFLMIGDERCETQLICGRYYQWTLLSCYSCFFFSGNLRHYCWQWMNGFHFALYTVLWNTSWCTKWLCQSAMLFSSISEATLLFTL